MATQNIFFEAPCGPDEEQHPSHPIPLDFTAEAVSTFTAGIII
jgi:hypothetical protein